jgi:hypothetical protein
MTLTRRVNVLSRTPARREVNRAARAGLTANDRDQRSPTVAYALSRRLLLERKRSSRKSETCKDTHRRPAPGWVGKLGFISGRGSESPLVGVQYTVKNNEKEPFGEPVVCEGGPGTVRIRARKGKTSSISTIGPVNTITDEFTQIYGESAPGVPSASSLEGKKPEHFEMFVRQHWEPAAMVATLHLHPESTEIKATK